MKKVLQWELFAAKPADGLLRGNAAALAETSTADWQAFLHFVEERQEHFVTAIGVESAIKTDVAQRQLAHAMRAAGVVGLKQRIEKQQLLHHVSKIAE